MRISHLMRDQNDLEFFKNMLSIREKMIMQMSNRNLNR